MCNSLWLPWPPNEVCQETSFLALAMVFTSLAYSFKNASKWMIKGFLMGRKLAMTGASNTLLCFCQFSSCCRTGNGLFKIAQNPLLSDHPKPKIQLFLNSPVTTDREYMFLSFLGSGGIQEIFLSTQNALESQMNRVPVKIATNKVKATEEQ